MHPLYQEFVLNLDNEDRRTCVELVLSKLATNEIDIVTLYETILTPALRDRFCMAKQREICVWEEHVRTSIVRTVIECCYPSVAAERNQKYGSTSKGRVIIVCPTEEYHEIGARMVADFFTLCGFEAIFVGANTPGDDIIEAIGYIKPVYVAVSVSDYYNLVAARKTVQKISAIRDKIGAGFRIIVGGYAFLQNPELCREMGADLLLHTFEDIKKLTEGD